jgi:hypothetical protein
VGQFRKVVNKYIERVNADGLKDLLKALNNSVDVERPEENLGILSFATDRALKSSFVPYVSSNPQLGITRN